MFAKFSKALHVIGAIAATVVTMAASGVVAVPSKVVAGAGVAAYLAGALGKALFGKPEQK